MFNAGIIARPAPVALSIVGTAQGRVTGTSFPTVTLTEPVGSQQNDIFVVMYGAYNESETGNPGVGTPSGWTSITSVLTSNLFGEHRLALIRRGASAPSLSFLQQNSSGASTISVYALLTVIRGVSPSLAIGSVYEGATMASVLGDGVGSVTPRTITTTGNNRLLLHYVNKIFQNSAEGTPTGSWIELFDGAISGSGTTQSGVIDWQLQPTAASVSGRTNVADAATYITTGGLAIKAS